MGIRDRVEKFKGEWKAAGQAIERNEQRRARQAKRKTPNSPVTGPVIDVTGLINDSGCHHSSGCTD
jgi:hypothetical protein